MIVNTMTKINICKDMSPNGFLDDKYIRVDIKTTKQMHVTDVLTNLSHIFHQRIDETETISRLHPIYAFIYWYVGTYYERPNILGIMYLVIVYDHE